ncbi:MAG: sialate O-acetylesterase, partial [Akkermansiaceae bacterium]
SASRRISEVILHQSQSTILLSKGFVKTMGYMIRKTPFSFVSLFVALLAISPAFASDGPIRVFILAGQSNMQGQGVVSMDHEEYYNGGKGNLVWSMENSQSKELMAHLKDQDGNWTVRDDVTISYKVKGKVRKGGLTIGYTGYGNSSHIGPELSFGHIVGNHVQEPVLLIKTAWGGKSLFQDFRPPSSGGETGPFYNQMISEVREALKDLGDAKYEICGFIWMQGWNDMVSKEATAEYEKNLINLANDIRKEFETSDLPIIIGELGNNGPAKPDSGMGQFRKAQKDAAAKITGAVFVPTAEFARPRELSPNPGHGHHWYGNAESYYLVGDALGKAIVKLLPN